MNSNKVGVITFHNYDNYGAILQSYALQICLKRLGADAEIINYNCSYISNPFQLKRIKNKGIFNYIYGAIGYICYLPRRRKCNVFRRCMNYSEPVDSKSIQKMDGRYDIYIAGSDQVWDWHLTDFDRSYFLDFVSKGKKCSYAASIGEHLPAKELQSEYTQLLNRFDHILMRESYGADVVAQLTGKKPECACDPTLLFTREEWESVMAPSKNRPPYILVYQLGVNPSFVDFVKRLKKKTGLPVIYIPFPLIGVLKCRLQIALGPSEWLRLFRDAQYVVTDSFHGAVFSILFNKTFFVRVDGHHVNRRVQELLNRLHLESRIIRDDLNDDVLTTGIDYTFANHELQNIRQDSLNKLSDIIS